MTDPAALPASRPSRLPGRRAYRAGVAVAVVTALLIVWTTVVRDDGSGAGFFLVIAGAAVGGFAGRWRAEGMARAMLGAAAMQALYGLALATAPVTASVAGGVLRAMIANAVFAALWLAAAACFRAADRAG